MSSIKLCIKKLTTKIPPCIERTKICCHNTKIFCKKFGRCCKRLTKKINIFCAKLCQGKTSCWINMICWLPVLIYLSIKIYVVPCITVVIGRILTLICCCLCREYCPEDYIFTDNEFPSNIKSLQLNDKELEKSILWIRAHELAIEQHKEEVELKINSIAPESEFAENKIVNNSQMYLFQNGINPSDVVQGKLGDCWLLAAIACLAEFPGAIENCFYSFEKNERHKYYIKLYDARKNIRQFKKIYIDDYIPCHIDSERPIFAKPKGNELWVLLLEKAFAKFMGSYGNLEGGHTMWAMQAMTGCHVMRFEYDDNSKENAIKFEHEADKYDDNSKENAIKFEHEEEEEDECDQIYENNNKMLENNIVPCWRSWTIEYYKATSTSLPKEDYDWVYEEQAFDNHKMWLLLCKYDKLGALISASCSNKNELKRKDGIVSGHAYTIKYIYSSNDFEYKLLNLRNPWGSFEWNGKWSDNDIDTWTKHKNIAEKVNFISANDGSFWIEWSDFLKIYDVIEICDRETLQNLHLNVNEDDNKIPYKLAICKGCIIGCYHYWFCCKGLKNVYFGRTSSSKQTIDTNNKCLSLFCPHITQNNGRQWKD
eukprot:264109_1